MKPVLTVAEMAEVDSAALESATHEELVRRAGRRVAGHGRRLMDGCYGRRVVVVAGKGSNGADGRVAASWLERWGARVLEVEAGTASVLPPADLVIDAAYGTGLSRPYSAPDGGLADVLAVDIPSGISGDTGENIGDAVRADVTVTFGALKPGLLLGAGPEHAGVVHVETIGLDCADSRCHLIEDADLGLLPRRQASAHKWESAVLVVGGQPGMLGAPLLATAAAMRAGAGYVIFGAPGTSASDVPYGEHVARTLPHRGWEEDLIDALGRVKAVALGPGLGRTAATAKGVRGLLERFDGPVILDADALFDLDLDALARRKASTVLTPHDGEFKPLTGDSPGVDRVADVRSLAARSGAVVLLKGATTIVAHPDGRVLLVMSGSPALATAGTGDVLTGAVAALCARGTDPFLAAGLAAHAHGRAAGVSNRLALVAGDLPGLLGGWLGKVVQ